MNGTCKGSKCFRMYVSVLKATRKPTACQAFILDWRRSTFSVGCPGLTRGPYKSMTCGSQASRWWWGSLVPRGQWTSAMISTGFSMRS